MAKILKLVLRILLIMGILILAGTNIAMAYIMFAPDIYPKPFYLMYLIPTEQVEDVASNPSHPYPDATQTPVLNFDVNDLKPGQGIMVDTGSKIVNLIDPTGRKYLRVGVVLEFAPTDPNYPNMTEEEKSTYINTINQEMTTRLPVINDVLITLFTSQTFDSVYTADGKEALREKVKTLINNQMPDQYVIYVYFTEFVVQ
jgi:flagellar basal body-associated protein FliL